MRALAPDLDATVADYIGEARFGAAILAADLAALAPASAILEVGAGAMLLSCALQAAGYRVTAVEPVGEGFSHMTRLRELVLDYAGQRGAVPALRPIPAELLDDVDTFDFAFSINVMEHVEDVGAVLRAVWASLRPGGAYRFVCPNYHFPFEPHFGIPTCGSKAMTWRLFRHRIRASTVVLDPEGTWASLNWITVAQVRRIGRHTLGVAPVFDRDITYCFLGRALTDPSFQRRHGRLIRLGAAALHASGLTTLAKLMPPGLQPAMSCRFERPV